MLVSAAQSNDAPHYSLIPWQALEQVLYDVFAEQQVDEPFHPLGRLAGDLTRLVDVRRHLARPDRAGDGQRLIDCA